MCPAAPVYQDQVVRRLSRQPTAQLKQPIIYTAAITRLLLLRRRLWLHNRQLLLLLLCLAVWCVIHLQ